MELSNNELLAREQVVQELTDNILDELKSTPKKKFSRTLEKKLKILAKLIGEVRD